MLYCSRLKNRFGVPRSNGSLTDLLSRSISSSPDSLALASVNHPLSWPIMPNYSHDLVTTSIESVLTTLEQIKTNWYRDDLEEGENSFMNVWYIQASQSIQRNLQLLCGQEYNEHHFNLRAEHTFPKYELATVTDYIEFLAHNSGLGRLYALPSHLVRNW